MEDSHTSSRKIKQVLDAVDGGLKHSHYYMLDEDNHPVPVTTDDYITWERAKKNQRNVKQEKINGYYISTVFLGINHSFKEQSAPVLFETMVFEEREGKERQSLQDEYQERYSTWDEALEGHQRAIEWTRKHPLKKRTKSKT